MSKCSSGRRIWDWYFSVIFLAIKVPTSYQRLPLPKSFPTSSPRRFRALELDCASFGNAGKYPTAQRHVPEYLVGHEGKTIMRVAAVALFRTVEVSGQTQRGDGRPLLFREAVLCLPPAVGAVQSAACWPLVLQLSRLN
jgi:hypothetical protein